MVVSKPWQNPCNENMLLMIVGGFGPCLPALNPVQKSVYMTTQGMLRAWTKDPDGAVQCQQGFPVRHPLWTSRSAREHSGLLHGASISCRLQLEAPVPDHTQCACSSTVAVDLIQLNRHRLKSPDLDMCFSCPHCKRAPGAWHDD